MNDADHGLSARKIPFDLGLALERGPIHEWINGKGTAYLGVGYSYALEFTEYAINQANPVISAVIQDAKLRQLGNLFNFQEANHAKYHRILNEKLLPNRTTREKYHPRVYDFFYGNYKSIREPLMRRLHEPRNEGDQRRAFGEVIFRTAAFETATCVTGLTFFDYFFEGDHLSGTLDMCKNRAVLYLFGYHLAEELEHCTTAMDIYRAVFNEPIWTTTTIERLLQQGQLPSEAEAHIAAFSAAKAVGSDLDLADLEDNEFAALLRQERLKLIVPGFDPGKGKCAEKRNSFVDKWDREWEPRLRDIIERDLEKA